MPRNGSGVYTLPTGINPVVTQTLCTSNWANTTMNDLANALTQSVSRDGQSAMTGNLNMAGFQILALGTPTQQGSAVSLGYIQTGQQFRLTNVSGSPNLVTALLPGGLTSFTLGQMVELIPQSNNTGAVTLNVNGVGFANVVSGLGKPLGPNSLVAGVLYLLTWDGAQWRILTSPNSTAFAQAAISGWDRPAVGTYPAITKVNGNTVNVPSGTGRIIAPGTRDNAGVNEITWAAQNVVLTNVLNAWATTLAVDGTGAIVQLIGNVQGQWARQYILLGTVAHIDGQVDGIVQQPAVFGDAGYTSFDLGVLFHNTIMAGGQVVPSANPLHIDINAGRMWLMGGNANNANQTNFIDFATQSNITFYPSTATNVVPGATQAAPVTQYDPAGLGTIVTIPDPPAQAVIHRLFLMAGQYIWAFGQTLYSDINTAIQNINADNATFKPPGKLIGATLFAYIITTKNATNLNDGIGGRIVGANAVSAGSSGGGAGVSEAPLTGLGYARRNAAWTEAPFYDASGNVTVGHNTDAIPVAFNINSAPAQTKALNFLSSGLVRWQFASSNAAEAGSNAGSDFTLQRFNDAGVYLDTPLAITRSTGNVTFGAGAVTFGNGPITFGTGTDTFGGPVNLLAGPLTIGSNTNATGAILYLNAAATVGRNISVQTAGKLRWIMGGSTSAETGSNVGTDFVINRYADDGVTFLNQPINIARATGNISLNGATTVSGALTSTGTITALQNFVSSNTAIVLGNTGAGTVYLRPNGYASTTGQCTVNASGQLGINSTTPGGLNVGSIYIADATVPSIAMMGGGGTYPNKYIASSASIWKVINNGYTFNMIGVQDFGTVCSFTVGGNIYPSADNAYLVGNGTTRWQTIYAVTGTINTCDVRGKNITGPNELGLGFVNAVAVSRFKYKVGHNDVEPLVDDEGKAILDDNGEFQSKITPVPGVRTHISGMAQDVVKALQAAGLDPSDSAIWALDDPNDPDSRQGLRTEQLLWVLWTAVQELSAQVAALKVEAGV